MEAEWIDLTPENLAEEHLCCIIRTRKPHPGVEAKRQWLAQRLREGHVFRKLREKATVFIEYAPPGDGLGPRPGGQLPLPVLPVGQRGPQGEGLRKGPDGALPG